MFIRCRKLNISLLFITQSYFSVPKDVRLNSTHYLIIKIINKKELQNIAIKKILIIKISWRFTESVQNNRILSWQLIKHCPQRTPWDLGNICFNLIKMTVADQIKILDKKTKKNEVQYDLYRKTAKLSAFFSNNLDKYEYFTGEDLRYKPSVVEKARFDYSPLSEFPNKGLKEEDEKEGPLKRLKNIENKSEESLKAIEDQGKKQVDAIKNIKADSKSSKMIGFFSGLSV